MQALPSAPWVLLRGLTREQAHWGLFPAQLAQALGSDAVITLDLPGAGTLHRARCPWHIAAMVPACRARLQAQGVRGPVHLLGLSMGGMVAAQWLLQHPQQVASAVLVNTSTRRLSPLPQRLQPACWPALLRLAVRWGRPEAEALVLRLTSAQPQAHAAALARWAAVQRERPVSRANALRQLAAAARYRLPPGRPACPVLVVNSAGDALVDPRCSAALARHWGCALAVHPRAGHDLPLDDGPWLAATVARWAADVLRR
ncbi:MAG: alpha/beta hydrolase [Burkholderiales bacterium]|nr:alpha/beta hydrolase [Burkholderiales bacterium]